MAPPLVTLLSEAPELQYVVLRNLEIILQRHPNVLSKEIRVFFCKYNDPLYVKLEKLEVIVKLCTDKNADQVLLELKDVYASEVDVDFVKKSISAMARIALKVPPSAQRCVQILVDLMTNKIDYVLQQVVIVMKNIFRKYPNQFEGVIPILSQHIEVLDNPEARAALIWILGEYANCIDDAVQLLQHFLTGFKDEVPQVQNQLLTAVVKLFLKKPEESQDLVLKNLKVATESENPDVRDRGYVYWRLLSTDPQVTSKIILTDKPIMSQEAPLLHPDLAAELERHLATLASVYHKTPSDFITPGERRAVAQVNTDATLQDLSQMGPNDILGTTPIPSSQEPEELLIAF